MKTNFFIHPKIFIYQIYLCFSLKVASNYKNKKSSKKLKECANPVFEKWISEMRDDAIARDLQSKHTYTKLIFQISLKF